MNKVSHIFMVSKNKVLQIFNASPTPVSILKAKNNKFIYINKNLVIEGFNSLFEENYESIFGVKIKKGDSILDYASKDRKEIVKGIYKQVFEGSTIVSNLKFDTLDGEKRYFTIKYKPAYDQQNNIIGSFISLLEKTAEQKAKIELEKNEAHFRALVENGSDVLFILKPDGDPKYISPSIKNVLGYTVEEAMSLNMTNSVHPDDLEMMMQEIGKCLAKPGEPMQVPPARLKDKQGEWHWFEGTLTNMLHDPAIEGIVDNFREVTERIEAEKDILDSKNKYQSLIQSINGIIWEDDPETLELTFLSAQCEQILGFSPEKWLKEKGFWEKHLHPNDRDKISELYKKKAKENQNFELEYRFKNANEDYVWIRDFITVENRVGSPAIVRGLMIDITEEKELKDNLDEAYKLAQIGTWEYDLKNRKISLSDIVKDIFEVEEEGRGISAILSVYEDNESRKRFKKALKQTIQQGSSYDDEFKIVSGSGKTRWVRSLGKAEVVDGKTVRIYGSVQDITERKQLEIELEEVHKISKIGKWEVDVANNVVHWSPVVKEIFEVPSDFLPKLDTIISFYTEGESRDTLQKTVDKAMEKSGSYDLEIQITTAKGNKKCIRNIGQSHFKDGKCIRIFGTAQDITDRKKAEIQLKETNKSLIERIKEQRCLYEISSLDEQKLTIPELLQKAVSIIPSGFQYAEFAETSITWDKSIYKSKNFKELNKFLTRSEQPLPRENLIIVVNYPSGISGVPENPFLEEEKTLLVAITQEISQKIDQIVTQTKLHQAEEKYKM